MIRVFLFSALALVSCTHSDKSIALSELEGAWWSDTTASVADFVIHDGKLWLDYDSQYHPVRIKKENVLVYDLGPYLGKIDRKIVKLEGDRLVLESPDGKEIVYGRPE